MEELVIISGSAFLNLLLHAFRFWSENPSEEKNIVYGLLLGFIENNTRYIKKIVPILHTNKKTIDMDDKFKKQVGNVNRIEQEKGSMNEVIGWYKSSFDGIKFLARDIKNHIWFQEYSSKFIALIFDPNNYNPPDSYGFSVFRLKGDKYYNMMTDYYKIPWEISDIEDIHTIIGDFKKFIKNYFLNIPLIKEINEN
ncbi:MAG: hypothetical protein ACTSQJ_12910 [Promethearchaeota archaeon]